MFANGVKGASWCLFVHMHYCGWLVSQQAKLMTLFCRFLNLMLLQQPPPPNKAGLFVFVTVMTLYCFVALSVVVVVLFTVDHFCTTLH